jgi:hypothetical protein
MSTNNRVSNEGGTGFHGLDKKTRLTHPNCGWRNCVKLSMDKNEQGKSTPNLESTVKRTGKKKNKKKMEEWDATRSYPDCLLCVQ